MKDLILFILICLNAPFIIQLPLLISDLIKKQSIIEFIINLVFFIITIICFICNTDTRTNIALFLIQLLLINLAKINKGI